jgi:single-stranded DNA-specific DHH superfamily exonuclease
LLEEIVILAKLTNDAYISREITAYSNFLLSKERAGIERAIGTNTLTQDAFGEGVREKFDKLISEQNSYVNSFKYYASNESIKFFEDTVSGKAVDEVKRIRETLVGAIEKHKLIASIGEYIGYGGIIHNFKNFVIRGDLKYEKRVNKQYDELIQLLNKYRDLPNLKPKELELIDIVAIGTVADIVPLSGDNRIFVANQK